MGSALGDLAFFRVWVLFGLKCVCVCVVAERLLTLQLNLLIGAVKICDCRSNVYMHAGVLVCVCVLTCAEGETDLEKEQLK